MKPRQTTNPETLTLRPIGYLRSVAESKYELPPQPDQSLHAQGVVEIVPGSNYEVALRDLDGFSRIWLIWWFHKNENWRPTTLPPRGRTGRKGTFASRSPYRPNPLGMSNVKLVGVDGPRLYIGSHDLLDETPILDIKPYIPEFDSFPQESAGWYDEMVADLSKPGFSLHLSPQAGELLNEQPELFRQLTEILSHDPYPHRTRRIVNYDDGYRIALGDWRCFYFVESDTVQIQRITNRLDLETDSE